MTGRRPVFGHDLHLDAVDPVFDQRPQGKVQPVLTVSGSLRSASALDRPLG
jgi:hypothetical protein